MGRAILQSEHGEDTLRHGSEVDVAAPTLETEGSEQAQPTARPSGRTFVPRDHVKDNSDLRG